MEIRKFAIQLSAVAAMASAGVAGAGHAASAAEPPVTSASVVDAAGTVRGSLSATPDLVNVCDWNADGVTVSIEYLFSDGTTSRRIAPLGGCTPAQPGGLQFVAVRGFAGTFANPWRPVV
jgi:hypothetical protein